MIRGEGFGALQREDYFLYNAVILEQRRQSETDFITPNPGRDGGNGIICLMSGAIDYRMSDGPSCSATEGDIIFLPRLSHYRCAFAAGKREPICRFILINFNIIDSRLRPIVLSDVIRVIRPSNPIAFENRFTDLLRLYRMGLTPPARIKARVLDLLTDLSGELYRENMISHGCETIGPGIRYLEQHFTENTPIEELAALCFVSQTSFRRLFREYAGMSPVRYRNALRVNRARELLQSGLFTAGEAAEELGFSDTAYFCRVFKSVTGTSPGEFMRRTVGRYGHIQIYDDLQSKKT
ncbi:MAG: helix-turn-helix transcriptional regulator [Clostridiales bacterium]|nr:helix-turn-helix transcriptional regulator [Clostridiales bacterium]